MRVFVLQVKIKKQTFLKCFYPNGSIYLKKVEFKKWYAKKTTNILQECHRKISDWVGANTTPKNSLKICYGNLENLRNKIEELERF